MSTVPLGDPGIGPCILGGASDRADTLAAAFGHGAGPWRIYVIIEHSTGRQYVGLTAQSLEDRLLDHRNTAPRRRRTSRPGSLGEAILASLAARRSFGAAFSIRLLAIAESPESARQLEADWIARLGCSAPAGFNLMPGGSSPGGVLNSVPVTLRDPELRTLAYPSLSRAIQATNEQRTLAGEAPIDAGLV